MRSRILRVKSLREITTAATKGDARIETAGKHVPWGDLGLGTYTAATKGCFDVIRRTESMMKNAVERCLESRKRRGAEEKKETFAIADFGTADAGTSLPLLRSVIETVRRAEPKTTIVVHYEDQPLNDWQSLFRGVLEGSHRNESFCTDSNVFVLASGTSFYRQCFPNDSIDISFCSTAMHWLSKVPAIVPDALHSACTTDDETRKAFERQAADDLSAIARMRHREMKPGGHFVLANFCVDDNGQFLGHSERVKESMHGVFSDLWMDVAGPDVHRATNFCNEYRTLEATAAPFDDKDGWTLHEAKNDVVPCPFLDEWQRGDVSDPAVHAERFVPTTRTWSNSTFRSGALACGRSEEEATELVDEMFRRYERLVRERPDDHAMDYVHSYVHASRAE